MTKQNTKNNFIIIIVLVCVFMVYNGFIYASKEEGGEVKLSKKAIQGEVLWQNNNCWSCHQIYGLGGYLGPDLTNIYSTPNKGFNYIKTFLNSGIKTMPKFNFTETEKNAIATFLQEVDKTGIYPNKNTIITTNGWVKIQYKNEK